MKTFIFVFGFLLFIAPAVWAIPPFLEMREPLGLTEEQVAKIEDINRSLRKSMIKKEAELKIAEVELQEMLESKDVNLAAVRTKLEDISKLQAEIRYQDIKATEDAKKILKPEQFKKFKDLPKPPRLPRGGEDLEQMKSRVENMSHRAMEMYKDHQFELQKRLDEIQKMLDTLKKDLEKK